MVLLSKSDADLSASANTGYNERRILELAKQLLKGRMFVGTLLEKYHVEKINSYRDVISVQEDEHQLMQALRDLLQHIAKFYVAEDWWIGITSPGTIGLPKTYCLWVELPDGNPLGKYWFKIRNVRFQKNEMILSLRMERTIEAESSINTSCTSTTSDTDNRLNDTHIFDSIDSFKETVEEWIHSASDSVWYFFSKVTTPNNIKEALVFLFLLIVACVTGLFELLKFLCDFLIRFMYAWSHFVQASVPILQIVLNFFENIFKVLCTFVAYMVKPRPQQPVYQSSAPPKYISYNNRRSLDYYPKQGVVITELN